MIGRAYLWGLAANGQAGVENVLDILRGGIDSALLGLGRADRRARPATTSSSRRDSRAASAAGSSPLMSDSVNDHAADVLAREQVTVAVVDLLERVPLSDDLVELEVA